MPLTSYYTNLHSSTTLTILPRLTFGVNGAHDLKSLNPSVKLFPDFLRPFLSQANKTTKQRPTTDSQCFKFATFTPLSQMPCT